MRELAGRLDRRLLAVCREEESIWACWLGGRHSLETEQALRALGEISLDGVSVTVGEPGEGLSGWRLSHRQAKAALPIAERKGQAVLRYADVALQAAILRDDLVATSLHQLYLEPLERARDGGQVARETLRAYFASRAERLLDRCHAGRRSPHGDESDPRHRGPLRPSPEGLRDGSGDGAALGRLIAPSQVDE